MKDMDRMTKRLIFPVKHVTTTTVALISFHLRRPSHQFYKHLKIATD
jgi:hypothetical protein